MSTLSVRKRNLPDEPGHDPLKRLRATSTNDSLGYDDYTVGWICALSIEMTAAEAMLDSIHAPLPAKPHDSNSYTLGSIADHHVVVTCLPSGHYGTNNAAVVANNMRRSFPATEKIFVVGIGGGVPEAGDIRLGDVVVSEQVVQYDLGKTVAHGKFHRTAFPTRPPQSLTTAVSKLQALHNREASQMLNILDETCQRHPGMRVFSHPGLPDCLFRNDYHHIELQDTCQNCDRSMHVERKPRENNIPKVHGGNIASGNQVIKDGVSRKALWKELDNACFEMEAAGIMDNIPCLVIRGICDYSDSHKNKKWQRYAAAVAAAYAKELLLAIPPCRLDKRLVDDDTLNDLQPSPIETWECILNSLVFEQIESRHDTIANAYSKTCEWFLSHQDYLAWMDPERFGDHQGFLWISGKPGAGKSTLMKFVYTRASKAAEAVADTEVVSFFFNARGSELEKSTLGMYRSLLLQILMKFPCLQDKLEKYLNIPIASWSLGSLQSLFRKALFGLSQKHLTCFINALDECDQGEVQAMVEDFEGLGQLAAQCRVGLRICFSSRHYPHIQVQVGLRVTLEDQSGHREDIREYIQKRLRAGNSKAAGDIADKILDKSSNVFIWVVLVVEILNKEFKNGRIFAVKRRLEELPPQISQLFKAILQRDNDNMGDLLLCIRWILFAKRPLTCQEFYFALVSGLDPSTDNLVDWDPDVITVEDMKLYLLSSSKGLAELTKAKKRPTIQFIHESVRDFLIKENGIQELWPEHADGFEAMSHEQLKKCCSAYLKIKTSHIIPSDWSRTKSGQIKQLRSEVSNLFPFLEYATSFLLLHAEAAGDRLSQLDFMLDEFNPRIWIIYHNLFAKFKKDFYRGGPKIGCILADQGCTTLIGQCLQLSPTSGPIRENELKLLFTILIHRHHDAATVLGGGEGKRIYAKSNALLLWAIQADHAETIKSLLTRDGTDFERLDHLGRTPLFVAAARGNQEICKLLLQVGRVNPDTRDYCGQSPLSIAVSINDQTITSLLLATGGVDPNSRDYGGRTPLSHASGQGSTEAIKLLLAIDGVEPDSRDNGGRTPLSHAAEKSAAEAIKLLLARDGVEPDSKDHEGRTPLSHAAEKSATDAIKLLLARDGVEPDSTDHEGRTPLSHAAERSFIEGVKLLLETGDVEPGSRDKKGRTPLSYASELSHPEIVKLLLENGCIDPDSRDDKGRSPLSYAAGEPFAVNETLSLLLAANGVDPDSRDKLGRTPLSYAVDNPFSGPTTIKLLLAAGDVDPDSRDYQGRTPLSHAASQRFGTLEGIKLLLATGSVDPDSRDYQGRTPLSHAASQRFGTLEGIKLLLATGSVDPGSMDSQGETPLSYAYTSVNVEVIRLLQMEVGF